MKNWNYGYNMEMIGITCLGEAVLTEKREHYMSSQTDTGSKSKNIWEDENIKYESMLFLKICFYCF